MFGNTIYEATNQKNHLLGNIIFEATRCRLKKTYYLYIVL